MMGGEAIAIGFATEMEMEFEGWEGKEGRLRYRRCFAPESVAWKECIGAFRFPQSHAHHIILSIFPSLKESPCLSGRLLAKQRK